MASSITILSMLHLCFLCSIVQAQNRAPHGLAYESPMVFSPSAFDFFHQNAESPKSDTPCVESDCAPLPLSSSSTSTNDAAASGAARSSLAYESKMSTRENGKGGVGAGGIAGIVFGCAFLVLVAMGVYYVAVTRRANAARANSVQPDV
ncbi:hypothetical protein Scep_004940 [Stephania cephalantha]|uniref:Transmembrane protein n=1 Tax=Stephania cephalantha TaxID=152367 RepID=A0AAP0PZL4_9MAGN